MTYETYEEIKLEVTHNKRIIKKFYDNYKKDLDRNSKAYFELYATTLICLTAQEERLRYQCYEVIKTEDAIKKWCDNDFENHYDIYTDYHKDNNPHKFNNNINEFEHFGLDWEDKMQYKRENKNKIGFY